MNLQIECERERETSCLACESVRLLARGMLFSFRHERRDRDAGGNTSAGEKELQSRSEQEMRSRSRSLRHTRVIVSFPAASLPLLETSDAIPILLTDSPPCLLHLSSTSCAANLAPNECNNKLPLRLVYPCLTKDLTTFGLLSHAVSPFYPVH